MVEILNSTLSIPVRIFLKNPPPPVMIPGVLKVKFGTDVDMSGPKFRPPPYN